MERSGPRCQVDRSTSPEQSSSIFATDCRSTVEGYHREELCHFIFLQSSILKSMTFQLMHFFSAELFLEALSSTEAAERRRWAFFQSHATSHPVTFAFLLIPCELAVKKVGKTRVPPNLVRFPNLLDIHGRRGT